MSSELRFNGSDYQAKFDNIRLTGQIQRIFSLMKDEKWRTLEEIHGVLGDPPASISAQLRHLRKKRFGCHTVNKRIRGEREKGLYEYQLIVNDEKYPAILEDDIDGPYRKYIEYLPGRAIVKEYVEKKIWIEVDLILHKKGYRYVGSGIWIKGTWGGG